MRRKPNTILWAVVGLMACMISLSVAGEPSSHTTVALLMIQDDVLILEPDDLLFLDAGGLVIVPGGTGGFGNDPSTFGLTGPDLTACIKYANKLCIDKCGANGSATCAAKGTDVCRSENDLDNAKTSIKKIADSSCTQVLPEERES
jgi:hypothetical protein